ncbi:hypothetical protein COT75_03425, partial [Candidatus Beckwithbacteria bacterium CG10_big_fil_rev_8_21_14_0_10_34_10]
MPASNNQDNNKKISFLTISQAASFLGVSSKTLRRWDAKGILVGLRTPGGQRRYQPEALKEFKARTDLTKAFVKQEPVVFSKPAIGSLLTTPVSRKPAGKNMPAGSSQKTSFLNISQAASFLGVSSKTLRRWDAKGILTSLRSRGGQRRYQPEILKKFQLQKNLTKAFVRRKPVVSSKPVLGPLLKLPVSRKPIRSVEKLVKDTDSKNNIYHLVTLFLILFLLFLSGEGLIATPWGKSLRRSFLARLIGLPFSPEIPSGPTTEDKEEEKEEIVLLEPDEGDYYLSLNLPLDFDLLPYLDDTYDIGSSVLEWQDLYLDGTAYIDILQVDEDATINNNLTVSNNIKVGWVDSDLIPAEDGKYDLGSNTKEWQDLFVDGTALIDLLQMGGNIIMPDDSFIGLGGVKGRLVFDDQGTDELNIIDANVGIGTSTPGATLDVKGSVIVDGGLTDIGLGTYSLANGDNDLGIAGDLEVVGNIVLNDGSNNYTGFIAQAMAGNVIYTLPAADAVVGNQVLASDAAGNLSWINAPAAAGALWTDGGTYLYPSNQESIRVYDAGSTDYIDIAHDGTDVNITTANTTALNIISTQVEIGNGTDYLQISTVGDLVFVDADGTASITGSVGGAFTVAAGAGQALTLTGNNSSVWSTSVGDLTIDAVAASLNLISGEDAADSIVISSDAGGIDIITVSTEDIDISASGGLNLFSSEVAADALYLGATGGTTATLHLTSNGTGTAAIDIDATGIGGDIDIDANDNITVDAGSIQLTGTDAAVTAIILNTSNAAGGIDIDTGTAGIDIDLAAGGPLAIDGDLVVIGNAGADGDVAVGANDLLVTGVLEVDTELEVDGSLDADGDVYIADTNISFDGVSTTFTTTGAFTLTPGGAVTLGDGGDTLAINSSDWNINTTGDMTNIGSITMDGTLELDLATGDPIIVFDTQSADKFTLGVDDSLADIFTIQTGGSLSSLTPSFVIDSSGEVGIGTTNPSYNLEVQGTLLATDYFSGDGTQGATTTTDGLTFKDGLYTSGSVTGFDNYSGWVLDGDTGTPEFIGTGNTA